ncbi:MAG TPA: rod shape-determining protein [Gemmatimonadales bacterium]
MDILLAQETGLPIHVDEDPLTCVVRGTGRILDEHDKYKSVLQV